MGISFDSISNDVRTPGHQVEFNSARARQGPSLKNYRALLVGQKLASGNVLQKVPTLISSKEEARDAFGAGSMLHQMADTWFQNNRNTETWAIALDDSTSPAAVKASATLTFPTSTSTAPGNIYLYLGGIRVVAAIPTGTDQDDIADKVKAAIDAYDADSGEDLPVTATVASNVVTLTAKHGGESGNSIDINTNVNQGEQYPPGVATPTGSAMSGGLNNPDITGIWPQLGQEQYDVIAVGFSDQTNINAVVTELDARWEPDEAIEGRAHFARYDGYASLVTFGGNNNSKHTLVWGGKSPTVPWCVAAGTAARDAAHFQLDPARPLQTLPLVGVKPPVISMRFTQSEYNTLLKNGISTYYVDAGGITRIQRAITTYQETPTGAPDTAYLDATTHATLAYLRYDWRNRILTKYPRHKLAKDGTKFAQGQAIMTPSLGKAEALTWFRQMESLGLVEGFDQFKADLLTEIDSGDPNRMNWLLVPDLVNQFRFGATQMAFTV